MKLFFKILGILFISILLIFFVGFGIYYADMQKKANLKVPPDTLKFKTVFGDYIELLKYNKEKPDTIKINTIKPIPIDSSKLISGEWKDMIEAIIYVESRGNDTIKKNGCWGCMQIKMCYVEDANRILVLKANKNKTPLDSVILFTTLDRLNRDKSIEMFQVINNYYNPKHDILKAIHLHNPTAPIAYQNLVLKRMNEIKLYRKTQIKQ
jgi:hypothetical protein